MAKREMITFYNRTKIGIDLVDQMCRSYDVARNSRRWPMVIFYDLLNISAINAFCVYKANKPENTTQRRKFIENFRRELIRLQLQFRSTLKELLVELRRRANILLGLREIQQPMENPKRKNYVGSCSLCPRSLSKSSRRDCCKCHKFACKEHMADICVSCLNN